MIDQKSLAMWGSYAPWGDAAQVEQDLVISRALIEIYNHTLLKEELAFRGGTALQKCFFENPTRYSEDIDLVQIKKGPIGAISNALHDTLNPWLGKPNVKRWAERLTFKYSYLSTDQNKKMRLKIEINTAENYNFLDFLEKPFAVGSDWYAGHTVIKTYQIDELISSKLCALYGRKKGRDLFDLARAIELLPLNVEQVLQCFNDYLRRYDKKISRAEFEDNLYRKRKSDEFKQDILPLLPIDKHHNFNHDFELVMDKIISKIPGDAWKGDKE